MAIKSVSIRIEEEMLNKTNYDVLSKMFFLNFRTFRFGIPFLKVVLNWECSNLIVLHTQFRF